METLFTLLSPTTAVLMDLGTPFGYAVTFVVLAAGITTAGAHALHRR